MSERARLSVQVRGWVQGVGFRYWVRQRARELGLRGSAANLPDGRVAIVAEGPRDACEALLDVLRGPAAPGTVTDLVTEWGDPLNEPVGFRIR